MKRTLVLAATLLVAALTAPPAWAKGPVEVVTLPIEPFLAHNPCTDEPHTVTGSVTLRIHEFELEDPARHHFNIQFFFDVVTDDGFSGRGVGPEIDNGAGLFGEEEGFGMLQSIGNANLSNDARQRIKFHARFHVNVVGGEIIAFVDDVSVFCAGKPPEAGP